MNKQIKSFCDQCNRKQYCKLWARDAFCQEWIEWFSLRWNETCNLFRKDQQNGVNSGTEKRTRDSM